jgi:hypothetical protein
MHRRFPYSGPVTRALSMLSTLAPGLAAAAGLGACLATELVDLGSNLDAGLREPDSAVSEPEASSDDVVTGPEASAVPEASATDAADAEGGPPPIVRELCVPNPSFETVPPAPPGTATPVVTEPPGWTLCNSGSSTESASSCGLAASNGTTCLGLPLGFPFLSASGMVDVTPCAPIEVGATYFITVELAVDAPDADGGQAGEPPALELRGSDTACDLDGNSLWELSAPANSCGWKTACGTFVANAAYTHLTLAAAISSSTSIVFLQTNLLVDNLQSLDACPLP